MSVIFIKKNGRKRYFKGYSSKTGKPEFSTSKAMALKRPDGYYVISELEQLRFYFREEIPELEDAEIDDTP